MEKMTKTEQVMKLEKVKALLSEEAAARDAGSLMKQIEQIAASGEDSPEKQERRTDVASDGAVRLAVLELKAEWRKDFNEFRDSLTGKYHDLDKKIDGKADTLGREIGGKVDDLNRKIRDWYIAIMALGSVIAVELAVVGVVMAVWEPFWRSG